MGEPSEAQEILPGDDLPEKDPRKPQDRRKPKRLWEDGDWLLRAVEDQGGALRAIPEVPRFKTRLEAIRWLKKSGDRLAGHQVAIFKMTDLIQVHTLSQPTVVLKAKPKVYLQDAE